MALYKELEAETGQGCGIFQPGSLYLAQTEAREHQLRLQEAKARRYKMNFYEVDRGEAERLHPLVDFDGIRCIMYEPEGGNVDPSGVTAAYAAGARQRGAEIHRFTPVTATEPQPDGSWIVRTPKGDIRARLGRQCRPGLWAREVASHGRLHAAADPDRAPVLRHRDHSRDRRPGPPAAIGGRPRRRILSAPGRFGPPVGAYERAMKFWAEDGTPLDFGHELFPDDLDRIEENMLRAIARVPAVGAAGVKKVINGPMIWSPDSAALFGPVPELRNYFCCAGIIPGFSQSGGLGQLAAEWMIEGEPSLDMFGWDLARFGTGPARISPRRGCRPIQPPLQDPFPLRGARRRPAGARPAPPMRCSGRSAACSASISAGSIRCGSLPRASRGKRPTASPGRTGGSRWAGKRACCATMSGIIDISNFAKYAVKGPGAEAWLDALFANRMPPKRRARLPDRR